MKQASVALGALSIAFITLPASALVTQPNGSIMPVASTNGEIQLSTLFANRGESLDFQQDGETEPSTFSPLCDFKAEFVLKQSSSSLGVGWYNVDPNATQAPTGNAIHIIVPAGSPVGTVITAADIKNDAAYAGGLIGFALVGGQTHYSEPKWNRICTGCTPPGPWITAVIYPSTVTSNAYYLAFEDGSVGSTPNSFNNDGDYNDYVYLFTGLTCVGGGEPCETGLLGVCSPGVTQCTSSGIECQGLVASSAESCDGLDNNCDGVTDEGDICPAGYVCDKGTCVEACGSGEFVCPPNKECDAGFCVDPLCVGISCDPGEVCVMGDCRAPCDGIACPYPGVCRVGACVDPCAGVTCEQGQVCDAGVCKASCTCAPCPSGLACEAQSGLCRDPSCIDHDCPAGTHCEGGTCVDSCAGAVCPSGQICTEGACVDDPNPGAGGGSTSGGVIVGSGGGTTGSGGGGANGNGGGGGGDDGGCGCRAAGAGAGIAPAASAIALALALLHRRRRRRAGGVMRRA